MPVHRKGAIKPQVMIGLLGKHGQHRSIEQPDQHRGKDMNGHRRKQAFHMELRKESIALRRPAHKSSGGKQVNWEPNAVVLKQSEDGRWNCHGDAAREAALHANPCCNSPEAQLRAVPGQLGDERSQCDRSRWSRLRLKRLPAHAVREVIPDKTTQPPKARSCRSRAE